MVSDLLHVLGVNFDGDELGSGPPIGDLGQRRRRVPDLHAEVLARHRGSWDAPPEAPVGWHLDGGMDDLRRHVAEIAAVRSSAGRWGWADPVGSFALPLWLAIEPDATVLLCVRNPAAAVASLSRGSHLSRWFGLELWRKYNGRVLDDVRPSQLVITHFEAWLDDPERELTRVASAVGLVVGDADIRSAAAGVEVRNDDGGRVPPLVSPPPPDGVLTLYEQLCDIAGFDLDVATRLAARREAEVSTEIEELRTALAAAHAEIEAMRVDLEAPAVLPGDDVRPATATASGTPAVHPSGHSPAPSRLAAAITEERRRRNEYELVKARVRHALESYVPAGATVAVVSRGDDELLSLGVHVTAQHFPATDDGTWAGFHPRDDVAAIDMLEQLRASGGQYLVFPATGVWWLDHYAGFAAYLDENHLLLHEDDGCILYDLSDTRGNAPVARRRTRLPAVRATSPVDDGGPGTTRDMTLIRRSGLFDDAFYSSEYDEPVGLALQDFCERGWSDGRQPNAHFDTRWYLRTYAGEMASVNPLVDYLESGETRRPGPMFDPQFYAHRYLDGKIGGAFADYLAHARLGDWRDPNEYFDAAYYLEENPDVSEAGVDPVLHYLYRGHSEGRNPSPRFETDYYRRRHLRGDIGINPLSHFLQIGRAEGRSTRVEDDSRVHGAVRSLAAPGEQYEDPDPTIAAGAARAVKAVAFYLPQFHTFAENDEWWGTGFTEWRNVARGMPRFAGHYQPRIPRDLGYYDLSDRRTMRRQVELAASAGLHGFSFYYYWFNGKRLLHEPLEAFLADPTLEFQFCLTWANENWTRRWDGQDHDVLMRQDYDAAADDALIDDIQRHFDDPRYIRVDGRPLLIIYRIDIIPGGRETIQRLRETWRARHDEDPLVFVAQTFSIQDPRPYGCDGAIEFPPHKLTQRARAINNELELFDPGLTGWVYDYAEVAAESIVEPYPDYPLIKTAVPSWDNDARRQGAGTVLHGSTPALYERWLRALVDTAEQHPVLGDRFVFINAWNEWAEAAYLEPDVHYGAAYLNATARAICRSSTDSRRRKVLLVGHDAHPYGAQLLLRRMGETIRHQFGCEVAFLLREGGPLAEEYATIGETVIAERGPSAEVVASFRRRGFDMAIVNTAASGGFTPYLDEAEFDLVTLVHELPETIAHYGLESALDAVVRHSDHVVVADELVAEGIARVTGRRPDQVVVRPQGIAFPVGEGADGQRVRERLGIPSSHRVVLGVGSGDLRKGVDVFVHAARLAMRRDNALHFVWLGAPNAEVMRWLTLDLDDALRERLHFVAFDPDAVSYYAAADVFFLSSREDPFPSVVLEALSTGLPVVGFAGCSGTQELIREHGRLVDHMDLTGAVDAILGCAYEDDPAALASRRAVVQERFRFDDYCFELLQLLDPMLRKVSVVVPNFNYRVHLAERLGSIFKQSYPVFEVLVLDDASVDDSLGELERIRMATGRQFGVMVNAENSGSVFEQWHRGCAAARGEYLWIAEADDSCRPEFLEELVPRLDAAAGGFGFTDSAKVDDRGESLGTTYTDYYRQVVGPLLDTDGTFCGQDFVRQCLAERNLVLNVSSVVWRRALLHDVIESALDELRSYRLAGDWDLYVRVALVSASVVYVAQALNVHRRHAAGVTASLDVSRHLEEVARVHDVISSLLPLSEDEVSAMVRYRALLAEQLGLADDAAEAEGARR